MMISLERIRHLFACHIPKDSRAAGRQLATRRSAETMAAIVVANTPSCREQEQAVESIRRAMFYANAAVACHPDGVFGPTPDASFIDKAFLDAAAVIEEALAEPGKTA